MRREALLIIVVVGLMEPAHATRFHLDWIQPRTLETCHALVRDHPNQLESYRCFWYVGMSRKRMKEAADRLRGLVRQAPQNHRARMYLGVIEMLRGRKGAAPLLRAAAEGLRKEGEYEGEVYARTTLAESLWYEGRMAEAANHLERAAAAAGASARTHLIGMVEIWRGLYAYHSHEYDSAATRFQKARALLVPKGPRWLQQRLWYGLGQLYRVTGQHRQAMKVMRRQASLAGKNQSAYVRAFALFQMAYEAGPLVRAGELSNKEWRRMIGEALRVAVRSGNRLAEANIRLWLLGGRDRNPVRAVEQLRKVVTLLRKAPDYAGAGTVPRMLAKALLHAQPKRTAEPQRLIDEAIRWARSHGRGWVLAEALLDRAYIRWKTSSPQLAKADALAAVDLVDRLRRRQLGERFRARVGAMWAYAYHFAAGNLIGSRGSPKPADLQAAFGILERLRAATLLEAFDRAGSRSRSSRSRRLRQERFAVLARIAKMQRHLMKRDLSPKIRGEALRDLRRIEGEEAAIYHRIALTDPAMATVVRAKVPSLRKLREALPEDTALVVFQIPPAVHEVRLMEGIRGWTLAATRGGVRVHSLPKRRFLERAVAMFLSQLERRDGSDAAGAARLYAEVLGPVLAGLPAQIRRLVIVPDGALHRVPFGALRPSPAGAPVALRFAISIAPSAGLWLRWRRKPVQVARAVLALADPALRTGAPSSRLRSAAPWYDGLRLGRLPHGNDEARAAVRTLGGASRMLTGAEATERLLKTVDLRPFGVLHLAAHAVIDEQVPERSAVILAPGRAEEDGLLQVREVVDLDLRGRVVVASACRSSSGAILAGEGVMSLARAFLQAGARAVIGSLWPIRDDEAAVLVEAFYRHLGAGKSVSDALAAAGRDRIRVGDPAAAWASLIVVGDGDAVLARGAEAPKRAVGWVPLVVPAVALALLLAALLAWRRRKSR